ncbi:response regulator [Chiayiivirga flava]|uniref:Two-component system KDP operon response regulator KdpE n=1 Tax=Chiayiivirga flava TaxID=659595 RepID=A0A7W8D5Z2_9GAMM|nr:response regulator [Chiayiivirga flava]MBB5208549.1 two-component system KDP operon response regulator KdpE [Chiayiivirga flava]
MPQRILVIDDEPQIRRFLGISLRALGFEVGEADSGGAGLADLATRGADAVVLDLGLPDRDGRDVLRDLRGWSKAPVIVLSVRSSESEKVALLDAGANDYMTKPFGVQELAARLRALLRERSADAAGTPVVFDDGRLRIDLAARRATLDGATLTLTRKEWALLAALLRHAGRVVTQPQLLREVWGADHDEDTHYLRVLVGKLRQKLGDDPAAPRYVATEPGVGLRFLAG